jgi:hypothetical protein
MASDCGGYLVLEPKRGYRAEQKAQVLAGYQARMSGRGAQRVFGVWRQPIMKWLKGHVDQLPHLSETLGMARPDDVLEFDEAGSFVERRDNQGWLWTVLCPRTRQIVAFALADRSEATCRQLWQAINLIATAVLTAIAGALMRRSCLLIPSIVLAKKLV